MSRKSYYKQDYKCPHCELLQQHYIWSDEIVETKHKCEKCKGEITIDNAVFQEAVEVPGILTMTKNRVGSDSAMNKKVKADRKKRSDEHFKKEIYPTIPKKDRGHFAKKHGLKS